MSKQGNRELRRLLILGATAYLRHEIARGPRDPWLRAMLARRPFKVVAVALAAKNARAIWAMLVSGELSSAPARRHGSAGRVSHTNNRPEEGVTWLP